MPKLNLEFLNSDRLCIHLFPPWITNMISKHPYHVPYIGWREKFSNLQNHYSSIQITIHVWKTLFIKKWKLPSNLGIRVITLTHFLDDRSFLSMSSTVEFHCSEKCTHASKLSSIGIFIPYNRYSLESPFINALIHK
jgi:hypothetical protein